MHRAHPYASAWRALQRRAVALGALQCDRPRPRAGAAMAMLTYRTPEEFAERFDAAHRQRKAACVSRAEDYLDHCGATVRRDDFADRVPAPI